MLYAGIGSRETPYEIQLEMVEIAKKLARRGWTLRSGGARGADKAFEIGAGEAKEIFYSDDMTAEALALAEQFHPAWNRCDAYARELHARNGLILLGRELNDWCSFVVCWTKDGGPTGGTGQALRIAGVCGIPIYNMFFGDVRAGVNAWG